MGAAAPNIIMRPQLLLLPLLFATIHAQAPPGAAQLQQLIDRARASAMRYEGRLPDFSCTKLTNRWEGGPNKKWKQRDSLEESVSFASNGRTQIHLVKRNGKTAKNQRDRFKGVIEDELLAGSLVPREIFGARAGARVEWSRWEVRQGRQLAVLAFQAKGENWPDGKTRYELKLSGKVYFDPAADEVVRIEIAQEGPPGYPFKESGWEMDYAPVTLSGRQLVLPVRGRTTITRGNAYYRNELEFTNYRKYGADATILVDEP